MRRMTTTALFVLSLAITIAAQTKPPVTPPEYGQFETLATVAARGGLSPDGKWLAYGSKRDGVRQLYVMRLNDKKEWRITDLAKGRAAMWPSWQPRAAP